MAVALSRFGRVIEMPDVGIVDRQGLRIAQAGNVKRQDGKEASCCGSRLLGLGYRHPWCLEVVKKQEKGGARAVPGR